MSDETLLGLPSYVSTGIVEHLSARDLCTFAQVRSPRLISPQPEQCSDDSLVCKRG